MACNGLRSRILLKESPRRRANRLEGWAWDDYPRRKIHLVPILAMTTETSSDRFATLRQKMVETQLRARGLRDPRVLAAMGKVLRHLFVADEHRESAYEDHPLPIGAGQTVSQPYIVAFMLEALAFDGSEFSDAGFYRLAGALADCLV